ncbi:MAG: hypothetical protein IKA23_06040 [Akkermansia sp.]|nr:hypothetical protein [Akkermansia sp.]
MCARLARRRFISMVLTATTTGTMCITDRVMSLRGIITAPALLCRITGTPSAITRRAGLMAMDRALAAADSFSTSPQFAETFFAASDMPDAPDAGKCVRKQILMRKS